MTLAPLGTQLNEFSRVGLPTDLNHYLICVIRWLLVLNQIKICMEGKDVDSVAHLLYSHMIGMRKTFKCERYQDMKKWGKKIQIEKKSQNCICQ